MYTMVSRPILRNIYTFAYKFYNIELGVANYTRVTSHGWLTIRWSLFSVCIRFSGTENLREDNPLLMGRVRHTFNKINTINTVKIEEMRKKIEEVVEHL